ncbi:MAG: DUF3073 domain-containing protein [Jatrophihabitantaceae bacterium]
MGRGRAKAKQQKVARDLKYNSQSTDLDALQRELGGYPSTTTDTVDDEDDDGNERDDWAQAGH